MKRFTETNKWDDPWFIRLPWQMKLLWLYVCDRCDAAGVIDFCPELASIHIGSEFGDDALIYFERRVKKLESGKWQIIKFLQFQYGTIDANCPAHKPVIRLIQSHHLNFPVLNLPNTLCSRVFGRAKEKEKDKDKEKKGECEGEAAKIYELYPRKVARPDALKAIAGALKKVPFETLSQKTVDYAQARLGQDPGLTPHPATWFNQERFNDDPATWKDRAGHNGPLSTADIRTKLKAIEDELGNTYWKRDKPDVAERRKKLIERKRELQQLLTK